MRICTLRHKINTIMIICDGTISPKGSHFQIKNRNCEPEGGIISSHIIDHRLLFSSHKSANFHVFMSRLTTCNVFTLWGNVFCIVVTILYVMLKAWTLIYLTSSMVITHVQSCAKNLPQYITAAIVIFLRLWDITCTNMTITIKHYIS